MFSYLECWRHGNCNQFIIHSMRLQYFHTWDCNFDDLPFKFSIDLNHGQNGVELYHQDPGIIILLSKLIPYYFSPEHENFFFLSSIIFYKQFLLILNHNFLYAVCQILLAFHNSFVKECEILQIYLHEACRLLLIHHLFIWKSMRASFNSSFIHLK